MTIIQTLPYTPDELAILKEKQNDVGIATLVGTLGTLFLFAIGSIIPGKRGQPSLYENAGIENLLIFTVMLCFGGLLMYFFNRWSLQNDIKSGMKTIASIEVTEKKMGVQYYRIFTDEEKPFDKFVVNKEIYHKFCKGDLITVEFAYFTRTIFMVKMPY